MTSTDVSESPVRPRSDDATSFSPPEGHDRWRLDVQWDGRNFVGWQSQLQGRSVQDTLHGALGRLGRAARPVAAGRTDAGVHALCMTAHVDVERGTLAPAPERLARALNALLPPDVGVLDATPAPPGFHARFSCRSRAYVYRLLRTRQRRPLEEGRALHVPQALDEGAMREAAALLLGRHDFAAFASREERQTVREVLALDVVASGEVLEVRVQGESFLRHMVRALVGTLLMVGDGRLTPPDVLEVLASTDRRRAGPNVPAHGLYFVRAHYDPTHDDFRHDDPLE